MLYVYIYEEKKEGDESQIRFKLEFEILDQILACFIICNTDLN